MVVHFSGKGFVATVGPGPAQSWSAGGLLPRSGRRFLVGPQLTPSSPPRKQLALAGTELPAARAAARAGGGTQRLIGLARTRRRRTEGTPKPKCAAADMVVRRSGPTGSTASGPTRSRSLPLGVTKICTRKLEESMIKIFLRVIDFREIAFVGESHSLYFFVVAG